MSDSSGHSVGDAFDEIKRRSTGEMKERLDNLDKEFEESNISEELSTLQADFSFFTCLYFFLNDCERYKNPRKRALQFIKAWEDRIRNAWVGRDKTPDGMAGGFLLKMLSDSVQTSKDEEKALNRLLSDLKKAANQLPEKNRE